MTKRTSKSDSEHRTLSQLDDLVAAFAEERDWSQFHTPKNLAMALAGEVGELLELFQWLTPEESAAVGDHVDPLHDEAAAEMADVLIYLVLLAQVLDVDLEAAARDKIAVNRTKYPPETSRGNARKYTKLSNLDRTDVP